MEDKVGEYLENGLAGGKELHPAEKKEIPWYIPGASYRCSF
ncbi:hypothetical protein MFLO_07972 [Listeria floridensis FSL S10-1187]|uniref:Uncharacterized protein n=1 Tax=Listeria floridensis FSL S10-1187 TaxID=1265817 RepID=A0ABN0RFU4_9LIST|nr:hypothetical protein [Listeria floridensis]EUJ32104.1 hypothetical protein MFLO_07972 [Listeria floridensis FSL S10-1187]